MDELLHWLEIRITSSLRPRTEEMKNLLLDHTYRSCLFEFLKNEDVHTLYIYFKLDKASLAATLSPPPVLQNKCVCFLKLGTAIKITAENIADQLISVDCDRLPLKYFDSLLHQVYLPLLTNNSAASGTYSNDKIIDVLHRLTGSLEVIAGHAQGYIVLPIPCLELLKNTSLFNKHGAAIHIMETSVIGWIRQIKAVLKHEPLAEIKAKGIMAGIYQEKEMWEMHIRNLDSISLQLNSAEAREIVYHLEQAKSMYGNSISAVTNDVQKAKHQAEENLMFVKTLVKCYDQLKSGRSHPEKQKCFFQMLHCLFFVWKHSGYYHQRKVFTNILRLMSNEVVQIACVLLGNHLLHNSQAYSLLKEALKICATFRGNYLDVKIKADEFNVMKMEENASLTKSKKAVEIVCNITMYEMPTPWVYGRDLSMNDKKQKDEEYAIWIESPWPLYNATCFQNMNMFMERCNDVLDLVETMRHFEVLKAVTAIGGAGTSSLDALVQDIWNSYCLAKDSFISQVKDIFVIDKNNPFQKAFFELRTTIKSLEHQLGNILRRSFDQCPTVASQLRLLEVFEGVSRRDIVKDHLKDKDLQLYTMLMEELQHVKQMYLEMVDNPPLHVNLTPAISNFLWIKGLRERISGPMVNLKRVSPVTLEGDMGWELRHIYNEISEELERFENSMVTSWVSAVNKEISDSLKLPLLKTAPVHDSGVFQQTIEINLNSDLLVYLREAEYFSKPPFTMKLPESIGSLVSIMERNRLKMMSTRLETVVSKYNEVMKSISPHQMAPFEKKLLKISEILKDGMSLFTWSMDESTDYIEFATSYICTDLYNSFSIVTNNYKLISELTASWCTANLDIFTCRDSSRSYAIAELMMKQKEIEYDLENMLVSDGHRIHSLVQQSLVACGISEASPAWQDYIMHIDAIILQGLKKLTISSLAALLNTLLDREHVAVLNIDVELINGEVAFNPPLDRSTSDTSVMEDIEEWLKMFLLRGSHIQGLSSNVKGGYQEYVSEDKEALQLIGLILQQAESGVQECQALLQDFRSYPYLWKNDINAEFQNFLCGKQTVGCITKKDVTENEVVPLIMNDFSEKPQNNQLIVAETAFILPRDTITNTMHGPLLEDFDSEISASKAIRDGIQELPDQQQCRWIQVDFRPVKQLLSAYALKWMWTFTKYLIDQTSATLKNLDSFLRRTEPQIERITGEERDTGSFMKMMRLFNEVSAKQAEMEVQFAVLQKTVSILGKYEMTLPFECEILYKTMPARWNTMRTKVSLAKQRLGPRIQQKADIVSKDLEKFQYKLDTLGSDIENSEVYMYECTAQNAFDIIDKINSQLQILQQEAKYFKELQELLETTVVDFSILNSCGELLQNLSLVWQHVDSIIKEQDVWKKELWQDMDTEEMHKRTGQQLILLQSLPGEVQEWDVYKQMLEALNVMNLTLPLIEDLSNPAMRTRHWKQLVRETGGMLRVTAESLKAMTLGDLLAMDLQKHTGDVRMTVQRAMRDLTTESSLKNCEEVWLSKIFDLGPHSRVISDRAGNEELASSVSGSHYTKGDMGRNLTTGKGSRRLSKQSDRGLHLSKKTGRGSTVSLYESLKQIEDFGKIQLLRNTESVFEELEHHQLVLTSIQPYAEAGSFLDDVTKWQKKLQVIETTVQLWLSVQDRWTQLEEVFSTLAFRVAMPREAILFADVHHHYCRLMKSVEENPNILQNCMRRGLQSLLDILNYKLERCQRAVRLHIDQKRQSFPRLYFLSLEDTLNIVCYGYDLKILSSYIVKMFHYVDGLIYQFNSEHECNQIYGVRSFLGEELYLTEPLECSGPVENWLPHLVNSIKASLQHHLWVAMEHSSTVITRRKEIHSAGARRVLINKTFSMGETAADERKISTSQDNEDSLSIATVDVGNQQSSHWVLSTLSDVAYLSTHIKFCREYNRNSDQRSELMQGCLKDLTEGIEYAAKILNEIPQEDIRLHSKRSSKAERKGNGQDESDVFETQQDVNPIAPQPALSAEDVVKLTNHILLLLYQRDVASQILSGTAPLWKQNQPLCYEFDDSTKEIVVKIGDSEVQYGYEYQGSAKHMIITPLTEQIVLSVMGAVSSGTNVMCAGPQASGKKSAIKEISLALGKPLFFFNCSNSLDNGILQDICKGLASAGAWVCLNALEQLSQPNLSLINQMLTQILSAKHLGKEMVTLQLEEVPLNTVGLCIAIIKRSPVGPEPYKLPDSLLHCFRIVGVRRCPISYILEAQLLLRGFSHVGYLAQKLSTVLNSFAKLHTADILVSGSFQNGKFTGSLVKELNSVLDEASNILNKYRNENQEQEENTDEDRKQQLEERAIVAAIHSFWLQQLSKDREYAFKMFLKAEWPNVFSSENNVYDRDTDFNNLDGLLPAVIAAKYGPGQQFPSSECTGENSVPSASIKAAEKCHIFPSNTFVSKVSHLVQLAPKYQTVLVTGPAGCGKTTCIKTFVQKLKDEGKKIKIDIVYTEALQSGQLLGFMDKNHGWVDGLLPQLLRMYCQPCSITDHSELNILHLDGKVNGYEIELMQSLYHGAELFTLENNECIRISESLLIFWELDTLANVSPSILCCMGILAMTSDDIDCKLPLKMWMTTQEEEHQPLIHQLTNTFLDPCLQFLRHKQILHPHGQGNEQRNEHRDLFLCEANVVQTFCRISKALLVHATDILGEDIKKYFIFSCIWSFGGWLDSNERTMFSNWWRHTYRNHTTFPAEGEVWDYHIDTDTRHFVRWHDTLSSYSVSHGQNMASEAFVHTLHNEQLLYLSSLLTISGCPVLLAGDTGCGKSFLSHELLNALCLGDVAEMSELRIPINRRRVQNPLLYAFIDSFEAYDKLYPRRLWSCLKDRLEWRHGTLHTPAGNKKLLCLLDDLNLAKTYKHGSQPACEFIRQLLDQERIFDPLSLNLKTIKGIIYLATWNTAAPEISPAHRQRLLRHFCIFHCKYPSQSEQFGIFSSILNAHFVTGVTEHKDFSSGNMAAEHLQGLIAAITKVSIELHKRLRTVFLGTSQRCHYVFTLRDLAKIFRNICLSLDGRTTADKFLRLWRHECNWVYGHRMSSAVDYNRYLQELTIAAQKEIMNEEEIQIIVGPQQPLFSNVAEDDGGLISTVARQQDVNLLRRSEKASSSTHILDGYQETFDSVHVKQLLTEALREYNKVNPRMSITFYQCTINLICRLSRNLGSPHGTAHTLLCGEGCPRSTSTVARLAAHLSGFSVVQLGSHIKIEDEEQRARNLKSQLVDCYVKAGLKGQRTMLLLTEEDIDSTALVYIAEFVVFGSVSHLFTLEQQATIAHAMRTEVTNAGLTYSKESAWSLFLQAVQQNIRWFLIRSDIGSIFYKWCQQFTSLFNALNVYYIPQWTREALVENANDHIEELSMLTKQDKENMCYLLSSMHLSITKYVKSSEKSYSKITNATFERFAQCFRALIKKQYSLIIKQHDLAKQALVHIELKLKSHEKLTDDLNHEKIVLEQHKEGTLKILQQIAQDKAVVEQKIHAVHQQLQKINKFRSLLPEYQDAHEKAEYKCSAILENIKDLVQNMDVAALGELRAMQKPDLDIEELMASIIIILKSPNTDLTWAKGAKRQMANLDRFMNELTTFHVAQLPQSTLELLESNIRKIQFTPENMEKKAAGNMAAGSLMRWLQRAVQYYQILTSKVKPLQARVVEMTIALEDAEQKMISLQQRKKALLSRLNDLERGFEEATMHKNKQQQRTVEIAHKLDQAAQIAQLLEEENKKYAAIVSSLPDRLSGIPGSTALAAGLVSYLGAYEHHFRQLMLTVEWPMTVKERGFPLMIDSIDPVKGRLIEFSVIFPNDFSVERQKNSSDTNTLKTEEKVNDEQTAWKPADQVEETNAFSFLPVITEDLYIDFIRALVMRIVKMDEVQKWSAKDWTPQQMENAAILSFSWQRPALLINPWFEGEVWIQDILGTTSENPFSSINLQARQDSSVLAPIEKSVISGGPLILNNYSSKWDDLLMPLIDHCCAAKEKNSLQDTSSIISFNGHRLLCSDNFRLYLAADELEPYFNTEISCGATIINYGFSEESLLELLLRKTFAKLQPNLYSNLLETANNILDHEKSLKELEKKSRECFISLQLNNMDSDVNIVAISEEKKKISNEVEKGRSHLTNLLEVRNTFYPIAQQGTVLYSILKSLRSLAQEYYFTFDFFLNLFDSAIDTKDKAKENVFQVKEETFPEDSFLLIPSKTDQQKNEAAKNKETMETGDVMPDSKTQLLTSLTESSTFILSSVQMSKIMDQLTQAVYRVIIESLLPEHSTPACALLFLCMQFLENNNAITEEEIDFFLKGSYTFSKENLKGSHYTLNPPSWLPYDRWEDLMFLSAISAQLSQLCKQITENDSEWEKWYKLDYQNLLSSDASTYEDDVNRGVFQLFPYTDMRSHLDDFHCLLIIRAIRPECFPDAVCQWVKQLSRDLGPQNYCQSIESIAVPDKNTFGILVTEPSGASSRTSYSGAILSHKAKQTITSTAQELNIPLLVVSVKNDNDEELETALNDTMNQNGWLIMQNLHLASKTMLKNLFKVLKYVAKMRVSQKEERQFCVWFTSEYGASIPKYFLAHLKKVSWYCLMMRKDGKKLLLNNEIYIERLPQLLLSAITSAMDEINEETCSRVKRKPIIIQRLYFGICVLHGVLQTQSIFPNMGLNHLMDMSFVQLHESLNVIISTYERMKDCNDNFYNAVVEEVNSVYSGLSITSVDASYIGALVHEIISSTFNSKEFIAFGHLSIPIPPADVDLEHYSSWLIDNITSKSIPKNPIFPSTAEKAAENAYASEFMHNLSMMHDPMQSSLSITSESCNTVKQLACLRNVIELVSEQLPPLIQIDDLNTLFQETYSINNGTAPEQQTSTYILQQECICMNIILKQIKHNISALSKSLLGGLTAIPENLRDIADALQRAEVPKSWLPSHSCQTSHNISIWLEGLQKKHKQLKQWVRKGLMPFAKSIKEALTSISVGVLVNPEALLLALRTEFAVHHGYLLHEVVLHCYVKEYSDYKQDSDVYPLYLEGLVLQGAEWDFQKKYLVESRNTYNPLPYLIIIPTVLGNLKQPADGTDFYQCPVYMNYTMESCVMKLPLLGTKPITQWQLKKVAIILNPEFDFNTSEAFVHAVVKKTQRTFPLLNSLTEVDKSSHSRIFNRSIKIKDSFLVKTHRHETPMNNDFESFSSEGVIANSLLMETANGSASLQEIVADTVDEIKVSGNNLASNQDDDKFMSGTVNDGHQLASVPDENEDGIEMRKNLAEESGFLEFQFDRAAETVNEPSIREHLMKHTRNTDYELTDNEHDHEDNNGNFDESENREYKEGLDTKWRDSFNKSLQDNSDYEADEYHTGFINEQDNVENNEQDFNYNNSTPDNTADENGVRSRGSNAQPFERSEILNADKEFWHDTEQ